MRAYRYFLCRAVGGEELCVKVLSFPLHTRTPLTWGLHLNPKRHHGQVTHIIISNDLPWLQWLPIIPQVDQECVAKLKKKTFATTTANWKYIPLFTFQKKCMPVSHFSACVLHLCMCLCGVESTSCFIFFRGGCSMAHSIGSCLMDSTICCSKGTFWEKTQTLQWVTRTL